MALDTTLAPAWLDPILDALDPEQRAAANLPDDPAQIIAPAGSGKTTTLIARMSVLLARGVRPDQICVVTLNRDAALDLARTTSGSSRSSLMARSASRARTTCGTTASRRSSARCSRSRRRARPGQ
jgi:superfamily I DNA/RNA helicase